MNSFKLILKNQSGIALMMVISTIVLLTAIMVDFTFEANVNKIKSYNIQDRAQARLNAEAGLNFAMVRLKLYQEAYNIIQKNDSAKGMIKQEMLNFVWNFPFAYPIPITKTMNATQKEMVNNFQENSVIQGEMLLTIQNISQKINLNLLRVHSFESLKEQEKSQTEKEEVSEYNLKKQLLVFFDNIMREKRENDIAFYNRYSGTNWEELVNILSMYVSDQRFDNYASLLEDDQGYKMEPKFAPLSLWSELYMMPRWSDELVDLLRNEYTAQGVVFIDLNQITEEMLKLLIPKISEQEIVDFFKYRDDSENPKFFNNVSDFKAYVVTQANIMTESDFTERFNGFKEQGIEFGVAPTVFRITSTGSKGRARYNLEAYVSIPVEPASIRTATPTNPDDQENMFINPDEENPEQRTPERRGQTDGQNTAQDKKAQVLLEPRVIEIFVN